MDIKRLYEDFKKYVEEMKEEDIRKSIDDALRHSENNFTENDKEKVD